MSHDPSDSERLVRTARRAEPDDDALARVWQRLQAPPPVDPGPDDTLDVPDPAALAATTRTIAGKLAFASGLKVVAATLVLAGVVIGGARWSDRAGEPPIVAPQAPIAAAPIATPHPPSGPPPIEATTREPATRRPRAAARVDLPEQPETDALAQERQLLAEAQAALQRGDLAETHARLDEHRRRFAGGILADEREVLRVLVLCDADRRAEALATAQALLTARGTGLFLPRLRGSCVGEQLVPIQRPRQAAADSR